MVLLPASALVREKERGTVQQLRQRSARIGRPGDDLPGPAPKSLRQPYPELRKPISGKTKRSRPDPFPELRKPPDQRRPRPEPFPPT